MATNAEVIARFLTEAGRSDPHFLYRGSTIFVSKDDSMLFWDATGNGRRTGRRTELLAQFHGDRYDQRGFMLLNGDGFEPREATAFQTQLREASHREFGWPRCPIIPFQALDGAGVNQSSIKLIDVTQETNDREVRVIEVDVAALFGSPDQLRALGWERTDSYTYEQWYAIQTWVGTYEGNRYTAQVRRTASSGAQNSSYSLNTLSIWAQPEFGQPAWQQMAAQTPMPNGSGRYYWAWQEVIHRLGAVVFVAQYDGLPGRHRFVSAFDMHEPGGLYFLAQLPDKGKVETFDQALDLLAPPMVHKWMELGKTVYRQGDVFALEIDHEDDWVYQDAEFVVRREVVLADHNRHFLNGTHPPAPKAHEVREKGTCPMCKCRPTVGNGAIARRAIMIHGTGHIADEVVIKKDGRTFIRGSMRHQPNLETPGREPEHQAINLSGAKGIQTWFLAIRNTVPRVKQRPQQVTEDAADTASGRQAIADNQQAERYRQAESRRLERAVA